MLSVAWHSLFDRDAFADRLAASLGDPRVAAFVADRLTDGVVRENPDLTAFRPLIVGTARGAVSTSGFQALVRTSARTAHTALFSEGGRSVIVSVPDVGVLLKSALKTANPSVAEKVPARVKGVLTSIGSRHVDRLVVRLWRLSSFSKRLGAALALVGLVFILAAFIMTGSPRRAIGRLGLRLLVAGVVLYLLVPAGAMIVATLPHDDLAKGAAAGLWRALTGSLRTWALVIGGTGLVFLAASRSLLERFDLRRTAGGFLARWKTREARAAGSSVRSCSSASERWGC